MAAAEGSPGASLWPGFLPWGSALWAEADRARAPVADWPPRWAVAWGDDAHGAWADLQVGKVAQRLRWMEPGSFLMGSPATEAGRQRGEGPQHRVILTEGFWLADTPCTQALWMAVMGGKNPSHFAEVAQAPDRPVKNVDWDDAQAFLVKLQRQLPTGCEPALPSEAQWEYACRAGTTSAYWWCDEMDPARANVQGRYKGTTPVKKFGPNPWGLHDMHGNVWEWCADGAYRTYSEAPVLDPVVSPEGDARAVRGGSWIGHAVDARAACRGLGRRGDRDPLQGFRLALRSPGPDQSRPGGPGVLGLVPASGRNPARP